MVALTNHLLTYCLAANSATILSTA